MLARFFTHLDMTTPAESAEPAAATSDRRRVEDLFVRIEVALTNVVYRWVWSRDDARDVVQEAFARLWHMRERVDWDRAEPLVYRIALNLASKRRRWSRVWQFVALGDHEASEVDDDSRDVAVREAIDALPDRHRRVLVMTMHAGMTYDQIGEALGISPGTVASRKSSAIAKLRVILTKRGIDV
jgi:RNA polymerase sigma-70 factor (ECF subfamily)